MCGEKENQSSYITVTGSSSEERRKAEWRGKNNNIKFCNTI